MNDMIVGDTKPSSPSSRGPRKRVGSSRSPLRKRDASRSPLRKRDAARSPLRTKSRSRSSSLEESRSRSRSNKSLGSASMASRSRSRDTYVLSKSSSMENMQQEDKEAKSRARRDRDAASRSSPRSLSKKSVGSRSHTSKSPSRSRSDKSLRSRSRSNKSPGSLSKKSVVSRSHTSKSPSRSRSDKSLRSRSRSNNSLGSRSKVSRSGSRSEVSKSSSKEMLIQQEEEAKRRARRAIRNDGPISPGAVSSGNSSSKEMLIQEEEEAKRRARRAIRNGGPISPGAVSSGNSRDRSTRKVREDNSRPGAVASSRSRDRGGRKAAQDTSASSERDPKRKDRRRTRATKPGVESATSDQDSSKSKFHSESNINTSPAGELLVTATTVEEGDINLSRKGGVLAAATTMGGEEEDEQRRARTEESVAAERDLRRAERRRAQEEMEEVERKEKFRKRRNKILCILLVLVIGGALGAYFSLRGKSSDAENQGIVESPWTLDPLIDSSLSPSLSPTDDPSSSPSDIQLKYEQPSLEECELVAAGLPINGQDEMYDRNFGVSLEVDLVEGSNIEDLLPELETNLKQLMVPDLIGCPRELFTKRRRLGDYPSGNINALSSHPRKLQSGLNIRFAIAKVVFSLTVTAEGCKKSDSPNCSLVAANLELKVRGEEKVIFLAGLIGEVLPNAKNIAAELKLTSPFKAVEVGIIESLDPTPAPTIAPTATASNTPTVVPTTSTSPTAAPDIGTTTQSPSKAVGTTTQSPSKAVPTRSPSTSPTAAPDIGTTTQSPSKAPSKAPTLLPTLPPTPTPPPTAAPQPGLTALPTDSPTKSPTSVSPTTTSPSSKPSSAPSALPTRRQTIAPTKNPTRRPSSTPSFSPSNSPSDQVTPAPTNAPSSSPTNAPRLGFVPLLRQGMVAEQSTTFNSNPLYAPGRAVDGNFYSYIHTAPGAYGPWWRVRVSDYYGRTVTVNKVTIWNRNHDCSAAQVDCQARLAGATVLLFSAGGNTLLATSPPLLGLVTETVDFGEVSGVGLVQLIHPFAEYIHFAEMEVWGGIPIDVNHLGYTGLLQQGMVAEQSTTWNSHPAYVPAKALDENFDSYIHTEPGDYGPWWRVRVSDYYGQTVIVNKVTIWNRSTNCDIGCQARLAGATVQLFAAGGNTLLATSSPLIGLAIETVDFGEVSGVELVQVKIDDSRLEWMHFAEIDAWGKVE